MNTLTTEQIETLKADYSRMATNGSLLPGIYIDCSAFSADDLNQQTVNNFAVRFGFQFDCAEIPDEETSPADFSQYWNDLGDDAVTYLNGLETRDGYYWEFDDNSLFLRDSEND